jgi:hypothetical protein
MIAAVDKKRREGGDNEDGSDNQDSRAFAHRALRLIDSSAAEREWGRSVPITAAHEPS